MPETLLPEAIVDLARVEAYLKRPVDGGDDDLLKSIINYVTGQMEQYTARRLMSRVYAAATALVQDGTGGSRLRVKEYPVTAFSAARERQKDGTTPVRTMTSTGYEIERSRTIYVPQDSFSKGTGNIELDVTAGIVADTAEHKALQGAALEWIQSMWQKQDSGLVLVNAVAVGGGSINLDPVAMPKSVEKALKPFRRW